MKKRFVGFIVFWVLLAFSLFPCNGFGGNSGRKITWRLGTTKEGGFSYRIGVGLAKVASDNCKSVYLEALPSPGYAANVRLVANRSFELGITQAAVIDAAYRRKPPFKKKPVVWLPYQLCTIFTGEMFVIGNSKLGMKTWDDLAGKRMFLGPMGSGSYVLARNFLKAAGVYNKIKEVQMGYSDAAAACAEGRLDAIFAYTTCGARSMPGWLRDVDSRWKFNYIEPTQAQKKACSVLAAVYGMDIRTPDFSGRQKMPKTIYALVAPTMIIVRPDLDPGKVYELVKVLFEKSKAIAQIVPGFKQFDEEKVQMNKRAISSIKSVPIHPGAARYFKEIGLWSGDWKEGKAASLPQ